MTQPQPAMAPAPMQDAYTDLPVGEVLRRTRDHYGRTLKDVERDLRIRACQIEAIEIGDMEQLPGRVYAIGFVRSYSEYLGLDGERMVTLFKSQASGVVETPELHFPVSAAESRLPSPMIIAGSLVSAVLVLVGWWYIQNNDRTLVTEIPSVPIELAEKLDPSGEAIGVVEGVTEAVVAEVEEQGVLLTITENSWVEIRDESDEIIVSRVLQVGDQYFVPDRPDLTMSLGNAGGVQIMLNGNEVPAFGARGDVRRDIPLSIEVLQKRIDEAAPKAPLEKTEQ